MSGNKDKTKITPTSGRKRLRPLYVVATAVVSCRRNAQRSRNVGRGKNKRFFYCHFKVTSDFNLLSRSLRTFDIVRCAVESSI